MFVPYQQVIEAEVNALHTEKTVVHIGRFSSSLCTLGEEAGEGCA